MFDFLGKKLEEFVADVNPWDNGATAATVRSKRSRPAPARTVRASSPNRGLQMGQAQRPQSLQVAAPKLNRESLKVNNIPTNRDVMRPLQVNEPSAQAFNATPERRRMEPLFKRGMSYEDIAKQGGFSDREVREYAGKYHQGYGDKGILGNAARGTGQFIDQTARNAAGIVSKPVNDIRASLDPAYRQEQNRNLHEINRRFQTGGLSSEGAMEQAQRIADQFTNKSVQQRDGQIGLRRGNVAEFGGKFAQQGIDVASVLPVAGGVAQGASRIAGAAGRAGAQRGLQRTANALSAGTRIRPTDNIVRDAVLSNAKQAGVYGTAQTGADVASGRGITPESLLLNYGADFAMGALPEIGIGAAAPAVVKGGRAATDATMYAGIKRPTNLTDDELMVAMKVRQAQEGMINRNDITPEEMVVYNGIQKKLGTQPGTPDAEMAVVQALGAHRNFDTQRQVREQQVLDGLEKSSTMARRLVPGGTLDAPLGKSSPAERIRRLAAPEASQVNAKRESIAPQSAAQQAGSPAIVANHRSIPEQPTQQPSSLQTSRSAESKPQNRVEPQTTYKDNTTNTPDNQVGRLDEADQQVYKAKYPDGALPITDVRKIKVKQSKGPEKNLPVREIVEDGDVLTATNVNPKVKVSEKRFSVDEEGKLIEDKKGATSLFTDADGKVKGFRVGKEYFSAKDLGDLSTVNGYGSTVATMRRNVERAFDKETGDKVSRFLVDHQQGQATKLIDRQLKLKGEMKSIADDLGINFAGGTRNAKKVSAAIQDFGEGKKNLDQLIDDFGPQQAKKIVNADKWFRKNYDELLGEMNTTLEKFGYDPVPKRKNYYTHFQDETLWKQFGLKMQEIRDLSSPTMQDANPSAGRGSISNKLAGMSENTVPNKAFNRFALQRKGDARTADAFKAFELYLNPTLNNIYMTPSIARARVLARAVAQDADIAGKDANKTIVQIREWANSLSGKSNRIGDRFLADTTYGPTILKALGWAQKATGQNTIVGNLSTAVMQPIVLAQTAGKFGYKNTMAGLYQEANGASRRLQNQSGFLRRRYADATPVTAGKTDVVRNVANEPLRFVEEHAARATWNAAHNDAVGRGLKGTAAIRDADINAEKTLSGRSIGERPEAFRSKSAGLATMFQLEVNNFWQQTGKEMSKTQVAKTLVTMYGLNLLLQEVTGRQVGFNPVDAAIDSYDELQKDRPADEKAKRIGQRWAGEVVDNAPFIGMATNTMFGEKAVKDFTGDESNSGRFGVASPIRTLIDNPWMALSPAAGSQIKKTGEAIPVLMEGKLKGKDGETLVNVPQTPENIAKGLAFGKGAIPEVNQYYNNLGKDKIDQKKVQNQSISKAANQSLDGLTKAQQEMVFTATDERKQSLIAEYKKDNEKTRKAKESGKPVSTATIENEGVKSLIEKNKQRTKSYKASFSDDDYAIVSMSKKDQNKLVSSGVITQKKLDGLTQYAERKRKELGYSTTGSTKEVNPKISESSKKILSKYYELDSDKRESWFAENNDAEFEYYKAKYENDKANGEISKIEDVRRRKLLAKDEVGAKYSKDTRDLYSLSKSDIYDFVTKDENGKKLAEELIDYDRQLYDKGLTQYLKFKNGLASASGGRGGKRGGGRKSKKGKFDYKLFGFDTKGKSNSKDLYDMVKAAQLKKSKTA